MIENRINISEIISARRMDPSFFRTRGTLKGLVSLSTYVNVKGGKRIPKGDSFTDGDTEYLYLRISDINDFENIDYSSFKNISTELFKKLERYEIHENEIAFSIAGTIGRVFIVKDIPSDKRVILTENCAKLSLKNRDVLPEFLKIVLDLPLIQQQINSNRIQTTIPKIGLDRIGKLQIPPVPPLEVQQRIVDIYSKASEQKRAKEQEAQTLLDSIDSYLLGELGITLPETPQRQLAFKVNISEMLGNRFDVSFYKNSRKNLLSTNKIDCTKLSEYITAINYGASVSNNYVESGIPFLRIKDLKSNVISITDIVYLSDTMEAELRTSRVKTNDFLISRSGTIGVTAIVEKDYDDFAFGSFMIKFSTDNINRLFLSYYMNSIVGRQYFETHKIGAIQGNITIPTIKNLPIPKIGIEKQNEIAKTISTIRAKASALQSEATAQLAAAKAQIEKIILG